MTERKSAVNFLKHLKNAMKIYRTFMRNKLNEYLIPNAHPSSILNAFHVTALRLNDARR